MSVAFFCLTEGGERMAKARKTGKKDFLWNPGEVSDKQQEFLDSTTMFTCFGG